LSGRLEDNFLWRNANARHGERPSLHMKFSAFNIDFSSPSPNPRGSRRPVQAGVKDSYPLKKWLFYRNYLV